MFKIQTLRSTGKCRLLRIPYRQYSNGRNHYDTLEIPKDATNDEIKKAYFEQSKQHHPDLKHGNQDKFREITSAYEVLGNPRLRKMYDRGLIFEKTSNENDGTSESTTSPSESGLSIENLNTWSKEQCSTTFARDQERRSSHMIKQHVKEQKNASKGSETAIWFIAGLAIIVGYIFRSSRKKLSENSQRKEK